MSINRRKIRLSMGSRTNRRRGVKVYLRGRATAGSERMERPRVILAQKIRGAKLAPAPAETAPKSYFDEAARKWAASMAAQK